MANLVDGSSRGYEKLGGSVGGSGRDGRGLEEISDLIARVEEVVFADVDAVRGRSERGLRSIGRLCMEIPRHIPTGVLR